MKVPTMSCINKQVFISLFPLWLQRLVATQDGTVGNQNTSSTPDAIAVGDTVGARRQTQTDDDYQPGILILPTPPPSAKVQHPPTLRKED